MNSIEAQPAEVADLSALVCRLVRELRKHAPANEIATKALDYLQRKELLSPLRDAAQPTKGVEWNAAIESVATLIEKKVADYDAEHGNTDPDTGAREYPGDGDEWVGQMYELAEEIRALSSALSQQSAEPVAKPKKFELTQEMRDALAKAADAGLSYAEMPGGSIMFINRGEPPEDSTDLDCPHCGGSGHKDDVAPPSDSGYKVPEGVSAALHAALLSSENLTRLRMAFEETKNNICQLLRDAWKLLDGEPSDGQIASAESKLGEAMVLARLVCKDEGL